MSRLHEAKNGIPPTAVTGPLVTIVELTEDEYEERWFHADTDTVFGPAASHKKVKP